MGGVGRDGRAAAVVAVGIAVLGIAAAALATLQTDQAGWVANVTADLVAACAFGPIGALIVRRRGNGVGWAMLAVGACLAVQGVGLQYGVLAATGRLELPRWQLVLTLTQQAWVATPVAAGFLFLLFPTGTLPGPRWRPVARLLVLVWGTLSVVAVVSLRRIKVTESAAVDFPNPLRVDAVAPVLHPTIPYLLLVGLAVLFVAVASLVVRFRQGAPDDRQRVKWLAYLAGLCLLYPPLAFGLAALGVPGADADAGFYAFFALVAVGVPLSIGSAILRHGLYDIDVVIRRTVVSTVLVTFFGVVYALVVGGIGALLHERSSTLLSFVAAAVVSLLSQPALARARRFADRLVFGRRATPYEVLASFSDLFGEIRSYDGVLAQMARVVGEGVGSREARVWLRVGDRLQVAASWPPDSRGLVAPVAVRGDEVPELLGDVTAAVRHDGELLGALTVAVPPSEPATPATRTLVADLAAQAGLVLRNVRLVEELRASRRRLVTAGDEERKRVERNLHDGAQQQLIALRLRLRMAEAVADDPDAVRATLEALGEATQAALDDLRALAHGIYPPLLRERGLVAALEGQARRSVVPVTVERAELARHPEDVEAAVYFCVLEALQNAAKYAGAGQVHVRIWEDGAGLCFSVTDEGAGFDPAVTGFGSGLQGMADRLAALGGSLALDSAPGAGTTVTGRLPTR